MGVTVAYLSSIALLILAGLETRSMDGMGDTTTYFDTVVLLTMFLLAGRYLEAYSKTRTADAITELGKLRPTEALVLESVSAGTPSTHSEKGYASADEDLEKGLHADQSDAMILEKARPSSSSSSPSDRIVMLKVPVDQLEAGDIVRVPHGTSPPADGTIVTPEGSNFDESSLTGESRLVKKERGDQVFVGTMNRGAMVDVKVSTLGGDTM